MKVKNIFNIVANLEAVGFTFDEIMEMPIYVEHEAGEVYSTVNCIYIGTEYPDSVDYYELERYPYLWDNIKNKYGKDPDTAILIIDDKLDCEEEVE